MSITITVRLDDEVAKKLQSEARITKKTRSEIVRLALQRRYLPAEPQSPYMLVKDIMEEAWADKGSLGSGMNARQQEEYLHKTMGRKRARPA